MIPFTVAILLTVTPNLKAIFPRKSYGPFRFSEQKASVDTEVLVTVYDKNDLIEFPALREVIKDCLHCELCCLLLREAEHARRDTAEGEAFWFANVVEHILFLLGYC